MVLQNRTTGTFGFRGGLLNRPPMPNDAAAYVDFRNGLHMDPTTALTTANASNVFSAFSSMQPGYYYGRDNIEYMTAKLWDRVEYDHNGECLGLLLEGSFKNRIEADHRQNIGLGVSVGAVVAASGAAAQPHQQWFLITPDGAGEASLTLATSAVATAGAYIYVGFDFRGDGIVQVGSAGTGYVNCDLRTGEISAFDDAAGHAVRRLDGSWTVYCVGRVPSGGLESLAPYAASIASLDAARRGGAGASVLVRAPRCDADTSSGRPFSGLWLHPSNDTHPAESLTPNVAGIGANDDFTIIYRARSGSFPRIAAGLGSIIGAGSLGVELRFSSANVITLGNRGTLSVVWTGETKWVPDTIYLVGFSRRGSTVCIYINGEGFAFDAGANSVGSFRPLRCFDQVSFPWSGYIQKAVWWAGGRTQDEIGRLVSRWL